MFYLELQIGGFSGNVIKNAITKLRDTLVDPEPQNYKLEIYTVGVKISGKKIV